MRLALVVMCALVAGACGKTEVSGTSVTGGPSAALPLEATCVTVAPGDFVVEPRNANAYVSWSVVESAHAYEVAITELATGNVVAVHSLTDTKWEWGAPGLGQGPYSARVRAVTSCGMGDWSVDDVFILNRSGTAVELPAPPAPPAPPGAPAAPMFACGTLQGHYVVDLLATSFQKGNPPVFAPLALPAGAYQVHVETNDAGHQPGKQTAQIEEVVTVWGVGTTQDIPDAATRQVTTFNVVLPKLAQVVVESGPHSVHGVCVAFVRK